MKQLFLLAAFVFFTSSLHAADPHWIWSTKNANHSAAAGDVYFRRTFNVDAPSKGLIEITADNRYDLFVNGRHVGASDAWQTRTKYDIGPLLVPGRNLIAVRGTNDAQDPAGLVAKINIEQKEKPAIEIVTDSEWIFTTRQFGNWARTDFDDSKWEPAVVLGVYGKTQPWGPAGSVQTPKELALVSKPRARELGFFDFRDGDRVVFLGSAFFERMQQHGYLETMITAGLPDKDITFRNLGWSGDNVWGDARAVFGNRADGFRRLLSDVNLCNPTVIIVCYGENEAYEGEDGIEAFRSGLNKLLDALEATGARLLLLSPRQHESLGYPLPDAKEYNESLKRYRDVISDVAKAREHPFIDLYDIANPDSAAEKSRLTQNGLHLTADGERQVAQQLLSRLGVPANDIHIAIDLDAPSLHAQGAQVFDLAATRDSVRFSAIWRHAELNQQTIAIRGLQPDKRYRLTIDDAGRFSAPGRKWETPLSVDYDDLRRTRMQFLIADKNALFFNRHRPQNETYLLLFRKHEQGNNAVELPQFDPLIAEKEKEIAALKKPLVHKFELKVVE
jgi:lysophospholipase L1-like esterase